MSAPRAGTVRETVCWLTRRNGAWLITWSGVLTQDSTPDETFDCARSLADAKRIGHQGATDFGYDNVSTRWVKENEGGTQWTLKGESEW